MLIKPAEDKKPRRLLLEAVQQRERLDARQRNWLCAERWRVAEPEAEEDEAGRCLAVFEASDNHAVLHDLRLESDGEVAEIDHLLIDRTLTFFVIDSHAYRASLHISPYGEFWGEYPGTRRFVIESPLARCGRNAALLGRVLARLGIVGRMRTRPACVPLVIAHPRATVTRPDPEAFDARRIIHADRFAAWHERFVSRLDPRALFHGAVNAHPADAVRQWGLAIAAGHRPADPLHLPDFIDAPAG